MVNFHEPGGDDGDDGTYDALTKNVVSGFSARLLSILVNIPSRILGVRPRNSLMPVLPSMEKLLPLYVIICK